MEINWNTEDGRIVIVFKYPDVHLRCIDEEKRIFKSSSGIIQEAIDRYLKKTDIHYSISSGRIEDTLTLTIKLNDYHKDISLKRLNKILHGIDSDIKNDIHNVINLK